MQVRLQIKYNFSVPFLNVPHDGVGATLLRTSNRSKFLAEYDSLQ